jgi:hypothetical protein
MTSKSYTRAQAACKGDPAWQPALFTVFVWVDMSGKGKPEPYRFRLGGYRTLAAAKTAIAEDRNAFSNYDWSCGGLIDWGSMKRGARHYRIFKCEAWTEVR